MRRDVSFLPHPRTRRKARRNREEVGNTTQGATSKTMPEIHEVSAADVVEDLPSDLEEGEDDDDDEE